MMAQRLSEYRTLVMPDYGGFDVYDADFDVRDLDLLSPARLRGVAGNGWEICVCCAQSRSKVELAIETWTGAPPLLDGGEGYQEMQLEIPTGQLVISERTRGAWDISVPEGMYRVRITAFGREEACRVVDEASLAGLLPDHDGTERYTFQMWPAA
ncbi:hypothetical protein [Streptomyces sp. NPDC057854]|uniref:hypothetical protein n=1 Tax=unclassified Streptomyces TaxID=2593676 RepID=UPI0036997294